MNSKDHDFQNAVRSLTNRFSNHIEVIYECCHNDRPKEKHHFSYKYPFLVLSLCHKCHFQWHGKLMKNGDNKLEESNYYCKCGYPLSFTSKWNGHKHIIIFYSGLKEITHCPACGEWLKDLDDLTKDHLLSPAEEAAQ